MHDCQKKSCHVVLGKHKTGGSITLPLTNQFTVTKTIAGDFQTAYNGKYVGVNIDAVDDGAKYFIVEVARGATTDDDTKWRIPSGSYAYRALDERGEPVGEWMSDVPAGTRNYLARIYDPKNNAPIIRDPTIQIKCPKNTVKVRQWGTMKWISTAYLFDKCSKLTSIKTDIDKPDFSATLYMNYMFNECTSFNEYIDPAYFDTSNVQNMTGMFRNCTSLNQNIALKTASLRDIDFMFANCTNFNGSFDVTNFNTSKVVSMVGTFTDCTKFNQPVKFDTSKVVSMYRMFHRCTTFNQTVNFDTRSVRGMDLMFHSCTSFNNGGQPITFDISSVRDMQSMFNSCSNLNSDVIFSGTSASLQRCDYMFASCRNFNSRVVIPSPSNSLVNTSYMFYDCRKLNVKPILDTSHVTNMDYMFSGCSAFNQNLSDWNVANVTIHRSFSEFTPLTSAQLPHFPN